jgi:hypothetical protein
MPIQSGSASALIENLKFLNISEDSIRAIGGYAKHDNSATWCTIPVKKPIKHRDDYSPAELRHFLAIAAPRLQQYESLQRLSQGFRVAGWLVGIAMILIMVLAALFGVRPNPFLGGVFGTLWILFAACFFSYVLADRKLHCPACNADALNRLENYCPQCGNTIKQRSSMISKGATCHHCKQIFFTLPALKYQGLGRKMPKNFSSKYCSCCGVQFSDRLIK